MRACNLYPRNMEIASSFHRLSPNRECKASGCSQQATALALEEHEKVVIIGKVRDKEASGERYCCNGFGSGAIIKEPRRAR